MLSFDINSPRLRTPTEEWEPHSRQSDTTTEWWYLTSLVFDAVGNPYFLVYCVFHFPGEKAHPGDVPSGQRFCSAMIGITDYGNDFHAGGNLPAVMGDEATWESEKSALHFRAEGTTGVWSFRGADMHLSVDSPYYSCDVEMTGADTVLYAKDKLDVPGFIQEGVPGDLSFYYSVPRLAISGQVGFTGADGNPKGVDVHGTAWVDRQWGNFLTKSWEWSSFRFVNGARVNLYNFASGYQVASYQKADGSCEWFDSFVVRQNNYLKASNGVWMSWGWSYEFPIDIEGGRRYTARPFSERDAYTSELNTLFEGPSRLIDDRTGAVVGYAVNESMDVKIMQNFPYGPNQR